MDHHAQPTLLDAPAGRKLRVERLDGNGEIRSRLCSMGILPGTEVEIYDAARGKGCVRVRVRQGSLVLGESMARAVCCAEQGQTLVPGECAARCSRRIPPDAPQR